jgi:hypothetical protein
MRAARAEAVRVSGLGELGPLVFEPGELMLRTHPLASTIVTFSLMAYLSACDSSGAGSGASAGQGGEAGSSAGAAGAVGSSTSGGGGQVGSSSGGAGASGSAGAGGMSAGGAGGAGAGADGGTAGGGDPVSEWKTANLTNYESYPDPNSEECVEFNGCTWAGMFAALDGKQTEQWVMEHNIIAVHQKDFDTYELKTLRLRMGDKEIDAVVYDMCADSDCDGCCTENSAETGFLIDIEKYTMQRFGAGDGIVEWACIDCD